jgi:predicted ATP-binding protein involved in virulence
MNPDVTIFIGDNGTGKTTLVNTLVGALLVDARMLDSVPFDNIEIQLKRTEGKGKSPRITITRVEQDVPYGVFNYEIRGQNFTIFSEHRRSPFRHRSRARQPRSEQQFQELKENMRQLVEVSWISVYRHPLVQTREDNRRFNVDRRLEQLTVGLSKYQLRLQNMMTERSGQFQRDVMLSLLYSQKLDDLSNFETMREKIYFEKQHEKDLARAFKELGIRESGQQIRHHFTEIRKAAKNITSYMKGSKKSLSLSDISPLPFATRTQRIVKLLEEAERDKDRIRQPIDAFLKTLHSFVDKKKFEVDPQTGELTVKILKGPRSTGEPIGLYHLSSGEKQLLIQLLEVLLQEGRAMIFFADEPELSLHVSWQEKLLPGLRKLNSNSQIIVATHSPDIVSEFRKNVVNMEDIVKNGI